MLLSWSYFRNFPLYIQEFIQDEEHPALQLALKMHELQGIGTCKKLAVFKFLPKKIPVKRNVALNLKKPNFPRSTNISATLGGGGGRSAKNVHPPFAKS